MARMQCLRDPPEQFEYRYRTARPNSYRWSPDEPFPQRLLHLAKARGSSFPIQRPSETNSLRQRELRVGVFPPKPVVSPSLDPPHLPSPILPCSNQTPSTKAAAT